MAQLVRKTQVNLFPNQIKTKADRVKEIKLKNIKPNIDQEYNSNLTSSLNLNKWEIYYLKIELYYKNNIPGYESYREGFITINIVHKYAGSPIIQEELINKINSEIVFEYSEPVRIKNITILKRLGYGAKD